MEEENTPVRIVLKFFECILVDLLIGYLLIHLNELIKFIKEIIRDRRLIRQLAHNDFKTRYSASFLGVFWAFVQPFVTILVYWFVFEKGMHASGINLRSGITAPFVLWLIAGLVPWFFFQEVLSGGTNALMEYSYLVKKVVFRVEILPIIKMMSCLMVHLIFVLIMGALFLCFGWMPQISWLQTMYYTFAAFMLSIALVYFTSAVQVFFKDMAQIVGICLQFGMWLTPIMWIVEASPLMGHPVIMKILKLNPMYYIVSGYRDTFLMKTWFWEHAGWTVYFWIFTILCFLFGSWVFKRLRIHFADVL